MFQNDSALEEIGNGCFSNSGIEEFQAPPDLKKIGPNAFSDCKNLKRAVLNEGLELLGEPGPKENKQYPDRGVFAGSGLESVTIPSTVRRLECGTFLDCKNLRDV